MRLFNAALTLRTNHIRFRLVAVVFEVMIQILCILRQLRRLLERLDDSGRFAVAIRLALAAVVALRRVDRLIQGNGFDVNRAAAGDVRRLCQVPERETQFAFRLVDLRQSLLFSSTSEYFFLP